MQGLRVAALGVLVAAPVWAGCSSEPPSDATGDRFCDVAVDDRFTSDDLAEVKAWSVEMSGIGTPDDAPEDVRAGLATVIEVISEADDVVELDGADVGFDATEEANVAAFRAYVAERCG